MKFIYPIFLVLGIAAAVLAAIIFAWMDRRNRRTLSLLASERLLQNLVASVSWHRRIFKRILLILAVLCLFFALARPQWGFRWEEVKRRGIDILFAMDVSKSMLTQDVKPDRLSRAKMAVADLVSQLDGDRVGLIAFAGKSFLQCPLTLDYEAFTESLNDLNTGTIPQPGTDMASAIEEAMTALQTQGSNYKILILVTDGEDLEQHAIQAAWQAAQEGLKIFAVGVGTRAGDLIPAQDEHGGVQFLKDKNGQIVKSRLDEDTLTKIAEATGGFYVPLGQRGEGLEKVYKDGLQSFSKEELSSKMQKVYLDRFQWPIALGLLFLVLEFLIHDKKGFAWNFSFAWFRQLKEKIKFRKVSQAVMIGILLFCAPSLHASASSAQKAYEKGDYVGSERQYRKEWESQKDQVALNFNLGDATYKNEKFEEAANLFQRTLASSDLQMQQKAYYNLGNTQYRLGQKTEKDDQEQTISRWQQAVQSYEAALRLNPKDEDAKFNLEFVKKKLAELQKQEQKDQQKKQDQQKQQQQQQQSQNQDKQQQEQQNQQQNSSEQKKESPDAKENKQKDQSSSKEEERKKQQQQRQSAAAEPRKPGEMSKEEAESLLNALKDEQAHPEKVQQVPVGTLKEPDRDW